MKESEPKSIHAHNDAMAISGFSSPLAAARDVINPCCMRTVDKFAALNHMMICNECNQLVKTFATDREFRHYLTFSKTRGRQIRAARYSERYVVVANKLS